MTRAASLLLAASLFAGPAYAQITPSLPEGAVRKDYPVIGSAPEFCQLGEPELARTAPPVNIRTVIGRVVSIEELTDRETLSTRAASVELAFDAACNFPHQITLESDNNGLFRQSATATAPVGFANAVPYRAELIWDEQSLTLDADALNRRTIRTLLSANEATAGPLILRLAVLPGATNITTHAPLLAGEYRDTLRITVGPR